MKLNKSDMIIILEDSTDKIINHLFQLQINKSSVVESFLLEHKSDSILSFQDKLNEKIDLIESMLLEEEEPVPPPTEPPPPPPSNPPPTPPTYPTGHHHHGGYGGFRRFRTFDSGMTHRFKRFRMYPHRNNTVTVRNTPDYGSMTAFDLYVYLSNKFKMWKRIYSKYKTAKTNDDVEMISHYSDKLKDMKLDIVSANTKLISKVKQMTTEEKKIFKTKIVKISKQMKIVNKFKD